MKINFKVIFPLLTIFSAASCANKITQTTLDLNLGVLAQLFLMSFLPVFWKYMESMKQKIGRV